MEETTKLMDLKMEAMLKMEEMKQDPQLKDVGIANSNKANSKEDLGKANSKKDMGKANSKVEEQKRPTLGITRGSHDLSHKISLFRKLNQY